MGHGLRPFAWPNHLEKMLMFFPNDCSHSRIIWKKNANVLSEWLLTLSNHLEKNANVFSEWLLTLSNHLEKMLMFFPGISRSKPYVSCSTP